MTNLYPPSEFDEWASRYDQSVAGNTGFPFDGYIEVITSIVDHCSPSRGACVLDLGIGTGNLSLPFAQRGCRIWGLDFSAEMLDLAHSKLPDATLAQADLRADWPPDFQRRFDFIVSAYTFHHFLLDEKVKLLQRLFDHSLAPAGKLVIGDIAFGSAAEQDQLRMSLGSEWEQEYYWLVDETFQTLALAGIHTSFYKVSYCAGIFIFNHGEKGNDVK